MTFIKFENSTKYLHKSCHVFLYKRFMNLTKLAFEKLGNPKMIEVYYDIDSKSIKIEKVDTGGRNVSMYGTVSLPVYNNMPLGRYIHDKDNIFVYSPKK